jgi:hypothetical protein
MSALRYLALMSRSKLMLPAAQAHRYVPLCMSATIEGDLIRPLGLVTLYFGYAEYELDALLDTLAKYGDTMAPSSKAMLGQKLASARDQLERLRSAVARELIDLLDEGRPLFDKRNVLLHSCILGGGRVISFQEDSPLPPVTPEQLARLAEAIFAWKERLSASRQLRLIPVLKGGKAPA